MSGPVGVLMVLLLLVLALASDASTAIAQTPTADYAAFERSIAQKAVILESTPLVGSGRARHFQGQLDVVAVVGFDVNALLGLSHDIAVLSDNARADSRARDLLLQVPEGELDDLEASIRNESGVLAVGKNFAASLDDYPDDPNWFGQYNAGAALLNLPPAWLVTTDTPGVRVAVLDTGISPVPDLAGRIDQGINFSGSGGPSDTTDPFGHGTAVGSIIAAATNNSIGIAGVSPNAHVVPVKVCIPYGPPGNVIAVCAGTLVKDGLIWLEQQIEAGDAVSVINMSFETDDQGPVSYELQVLDEAYGVISVASSGNEGTTGNPSVAFPASDPNVVGVGGVLPNGQRRDFSNYGPELDLAAPAQTYALNNIDAPEYFEGTSAAAPFIAGLAALFKSTQPVFAFGGDPGRLSTRDALIKAARRSGDGSEMKSFSNETGYGVPDAFTTIWAGACARFDFSGDGQINLSDLQMIAFRWATSTGMTWYDQRYDVQPLLIADGDIDILDLQAAFGRDPSYCPV